MYIAGTILERREPLDNALDEIKVVGISPVRTTGIAEWSGGGGEFYIISPAKMFAGNEVAPESVLNTLYTIQSIPEDELDVVVPTPKQRIARLESPEQIFARKANEPAPVNAVAVADVIDAVVEKRGPGRPKAS